MAMHAGASFDLDANPALRWMRGHLDLTSGFHGEAFRVRSGGAWRYTPLFVVMVLIGLIDVVFAVDSIPAIFAITDDPFIVLTSNVFAVLGLRAMYFLLADFAGRFHLLTYGLAAILVFIGAKMLIVDLVKIPVYASIAVVAAILAASVVASGATRPRAAADAKPR